MKIIAYGIKAAGIKGKITAFEFTDEELAEFIQDELDEKRYFGGLEDEWKNSLIRYTDKELLEIFPESYEVQRQKLEKEYSDSARRFYEAKQKGENMEGLLKEKFNRKIRYEIFTHRPQDDKTLSQLEISKARDYPLERLIESKKFFALCPFHNEKTPSFYIKKNFYYCFGCGEKGDTIAFVMKTKGYTFPQAVKFLQ